MLKCTHVVETYIYEICYLDIIEKLVLAFLKVGPIGVYFLPINLFDW